MRNLCVFSHEILICGLPRSDGRGARELADLWFWLREGCKKVSHEEALKSVLSGFCFAFAQSEIKKQHP